MPGAAEVIADPAIDQLVVTDAVPAFRLDRRAQSKVVTLARRPAARRDDPAPARGAQPDRSHGVLKKHLKLSCALVGKREIAGGQTRPLLRRARMLFQKMRDGEPRPQRRAMAAIEREQFLDRPVTQHAFHPAFDIGPDPSRTEPLAFETEIGNLVERVDHPKPRVEFEAVDDADFVIDANMFGTQVAMAVNDPAMAKACGDEMAAPLQKPALRPIDAAHEAGRNAETRIEQDAPVIGEAALPVGKMDRRRKKDRRRRAIKLRENGDKPVELRNFDPPLVNDAVEHVALIEPLHDTSQSTGVPAPPIERPAPVSTSGKTSR